MIDPGGDEHRLVNREALAADDRQKIRCHQREQQRAQQFGPASPERSHERRPVSLRRVVVVGSCGGRRLHGPLTKRRYYGVSSVSAPADSASRRFCPAAKTCHTFAFPHRILKPLDGGFNLRLTARILLSLSLVAGIILANFAPAFAQAPAPKRAPAKGGSPVERVGSTGILQLEAESFKFCRRVIQLTR